MHPPQNRTTDMCFQGEHGFLRNDMMVRIHQPLLLGSNMDVKALNLQGIFFWLQNKQTVHLMVKKNGSLQIELLQGATLANFCHFAKLLNTRCQHLMLLKLSIGEHCSTDER